VKKEKSEFNLKSSALLCCFAFCILHFAFCSYAEEAKTPIIVNGDQVEYSTDNKEVTAVGNVVIVYKDSKLTCNNLRINTQTKDAIASGNVRLEDKKGVVEAQEMQYNFESQTGTLIQAKIWSAPYYGAGKTILRVSENRYDVKDGYMTTCDLDKPHYRIGSRIIEFYQGDKIKSKNDTFYLGKMPLAYLPQYTHSLKDPLMHVQLMPGKSKDWGMFMLSAWRYSLTENITGRIYLDYREQLGVAEGFGANYNAKTFGKGDFKYYYTQERSRKFDEGIPAEFQRYFIRWRHQWDVDLRTKLTSEYYKIVDSKRIIHGSEWNILKDYFPREYEQDTLPLSYVLLHHGFNNSSLDLTIQKRVNRWYTQIEKLPDLSYNLPSYRLGETPLYLNNQSSFVNLNQKNAVPSPSSADVSVTRFDTYNQLSLPSKIFFIWISPYVGVRETFYNKDINGSTLWSNPRTILYSGAEMSTKFYRLFNFKSHFLGTDINDFRHIITPTINYAYNDNPTIVPSELKQLDSIDAIDRNNKITLGLENKLQTKDAKKKTVDFATLLITTDYRLKPKGGNGSSFSDFIFDLELLPYSWLRIESDATYDHFSDSFRTANFDAYADLGKERTFGIGHRYERKGGKELTSELNWRLTPLWRFKVYERYQFAAARNQGLKQQEYTIARDLHCWEVELTYSVNRGHGETVWLVFRLKAFPELEFDFNRSYHQPKPGSHTE